jgi:glucosyl-3-phosphoglycerate synthase
MDERAAKWFRQHTSTSDNWPIEAVLAAKRASGDRISVVIPARNEQASVGEVVDRIQVALMQDAPLVDELIVMDSLSTDATAAVAREHGATVWGVGDVAPQLGTASGKGEALWKSLFVTTGTLLVFIDADLSEWGTHFVTGLLGPLLADQQTLLVKGFYDRLMDDAPDVQGTDGGRVTELVARPLLAARWPQLSAVVQPLAGEWAIRRRHFERLTVPVGYGIEFATLVDTWAQHGLDAIAQVDLGRRGHRHQSVHDLGVMATEILHVAARRGAGLGSTDVDSIELNQYDRAIEGGWRARLIPVGERPAAIEVDGYESPAQPLVAPC